MSETQNELSVLPEGTTMKTKPVETTLLLEQLINLYEPIARACCRSYRVQKDEVDDIVSDTFLAAYRNLPKIRERTKLSSWLWTIARYQIVTKLRKESMCKRCELTNMAPQTLLSNHNPATSAQASELRKRLNAGIASLPRTWVIIIKLYYWHQKNPYEIAMRLQVKPGTVRVILHRSRQRLRQELEGMYAA